MIHAISLYQNMKETNFNKTYATFKTHFEKNKTVDPCRKDYKYRQVRPKKP